MDINNIWKEITGAIAVIGVIVAWIKVKIKKWSPILSPMITAAEKACIDGKITKDERKEIVMAGVIAAEKEGKIKLNFITRIIISKVVDKIAKALPDIIINKPS